MDILHNCPQEFTYTPELSVELNILTYMQCNLNSLYYYNHTHNYPVTTIRITTLNKLYQYQYCYKAMELHISKKKSYGIDEVPKGSKSFNIKVIV